MDSVNSSTGWDAILSQGGYYAQAFGMFMQGQSYLQHGAAQATAARFAGDQMRMNASDAIGASDRTAYDIQRQADYIASTQLARAAASGGGASDPTVMNLIARTKGEAAYKQAIALYEGQSRARSLRMGAAGEEFTGRDEMRQGRLAAFGASIGSASVLAKGGVSLYTKYGGGGPSKVNDETFGGGGTGYGFDS